MTTDVARLEGADPAGAGVDRTAPRPAWLSGGDAAVLGLVVALEVAAGIGLLAGALAWWMLVALHVAAVAALAWRVGATAREGGDTVRLLFATMLTAVGGPPGAIVGVVALMLVPREVKETPLLAAWYARIAESTRPDPVTALCDSVAIGRGLDLSAPAPAAFATVIREGSLGEQQAALGLIARDYHPAYLRAIARALHSPEPVIRVQAAAVAARLREGIVRSLEAALLRARHVEGTVATLALIEEIDATAASGLVDPTLAARGGQTSRRLKTQMLTALSSVECGLLAGRLAAERGPDAALIGAQTLAGLESQLAQARLWTHLRAAQRAARVVRAGFKVRGRRERAGRKVALA